MVRARMRFPRCLILCQVRRTENSHLPKNFQWWGSSAVLYLYRLRIETAPGILGIFGDVQEAKEFFSVSRRLQKVPKKQLSHSTSQYRLLPASLGPPSAWQALPRKFSSLLQEFKEGFLVWSGVWVYRRGSHWHKGKVTPPSCGSSQMLWVSNS